MRVTDFTALHDAMAEAFKTGIKGIKTVDALSDEPPSDGVMTPAVFIGVDELGQAKKLTDGRVALTVNFSAACLLSSKSKRANLSILNMAASVAAVVSGNTWGMGELVGPPKALAAVPGEFSKGGAGLISWVVSWEQVIHVGSEWSPPNHSGKEVDEDGNHAELDGYDGFWVANCHDERHKLEDPTGE